jgi:hypothetical protein
LPASRREVLREAPGDGLHDGRRERLVVVAVLEEDVGIGRKPPLDVFHVGRCVGVVAALQHPCDRRERPEAGDRAS